MKKIIISSLFAAVVTCVMTAQSAPPAAGADAKVNTDNNREASQSSNDFFGQTIAGHWVFTSELGYSQEYDDNVFASPFTRLSDNVSRFNGRFSMAVQKKRARIQVHYYPDYVVYSKYSDRNALSHQYAHEVNYHWSGHTDINWTLTASRAPSYTNSPFTLVNFEGLFLPVFRPDALQSNATISNSST